MSDYAELLRQMTKGTLDAGAFCHADHIGVAYEALAHSTYFEALYMVAAGIDNAATRAGATDKFNATITATFMSLIAERMGQGKYQDAQDFIDRNPDLVRGTPLRSLFSTARLASDQARRIALLPDLLRRDRASD